LTFVVPRLIRPFLRICASLVLAIALHGTPCSAEPTRASVRLVWDANTGTEKCLTQDELERLVEVQLDREVFARGDVEVENLIRVRIEPSSETGGFKAVVSADRTEPNAAVPRSPEVRELFAAGDCRLLDEQLILVVALLVDTELGSAEKADPPEPVAPEPPEPPPSPEETQPLGPVSSAPNWETAQRTARWGFEADAAAAAGAGVLPHLGVGAEVGFLAAPPSLPALRLRVLGFVSQPAELVDGASVGFLYGIAGASLCPTLGSWPELRVRTCLGADIGVLHARSRGLMDSREIAQVFAQAGVSLRGTLELGRSWLALLSLGAAVPTKLDRFVYRNDGRTEEIFQMAFVPVFATLGVSYELR
jgi:hypothetical protein